VRLGSGEAHGLRRVGGTVFISVLGGFCENRRPFGVHDLFGVLSAQKL